MMPKFHDTEDIFDDQASEPALSPSATPFELQRLACLLT